MKVITVCGSLKFAKEIIDVALKLELEGNCMLTPISSNGMDKDAFSQEELNMLRAMHKEKIKMSDAILVVNVDGYIGDSTKDEIEYAKSLDKEIIYYTDLMKEEENV